MDIHKPKPWHSVREFLKEYVIIVVGVLTALGAEQGVEWLHWRHEVHLAREAIGFDLRRILAWDGAAGSELPCVATHLKTMAADLDQATQSHRLAPLGWAGAPRAHSLSWNMRSWSALTSSQVLTHIPNREQLLLAAIAQRLDFANRTRDDADQMWSNLRVMSGPARAVSDGELASLRFALQRAIRQDASLAFGGDQLATMALQSGLIDRAQAEAAWQEGVAYGKTSPLCAPTPPPPAGPFDDAIQRYIDRPTLPPGQAKLDGLGVSGAVSTER